jgi:hypothetical protein
VFPAPKGGAGAVHAHACGIVAKYASPAFNLL